MDSLALQSDIQAKVDKLRMNQVNRVVNIDDKLQDYESKLRIKSVKDFIDLSNHQRTLLGFVNSKEKDGTTIINNFFTENSEGSRKIMDFCKQFGETRETSSDADNGTDGLILSAEVHTPEG